MYYISSFISGDTFGVTDTSDGSEELHTASAIREFIRLGLSIKGVDGNLIYPTLPVKYTCYAGEVMQRDWKVCAITRSSCYAKNKLYILRDNKLYQPRSILCELKDGVVKEVLNEKDNTFLRGYKVYPIGQVVSVPSVRTLLGLSDPQLSFHPKKVLTHRSITPAGISYTVLDTGKLTVSDKYNDLAVLSNVLLEDIVRDINNYANATVSDGVLTVDAFDMAVSYRLDTLSCVYNRVFSDSSKLAVTRDRLLGRSATMMYENGDLVEAHTVDNVLRIPNKARKIVTRSLHLSAGDNNIMVPESVKSVDRDCFVFDYLSKNHVILTLDASSAEVLGTMVYGRRGLSYTIKADSKEVLLHALLAALRVNCASDYDIRCDAAGSDFVKDITKMVTCVGISEADADWIMGSLDKKFRIKAGLRDDIKLNVRGVAAAAGRWGLSNSFLSITPYNSVSRFGVALAFIKPLLSREASVRYSALYKSYCDAIMQRASYLNNYLESHPERVKELALNGQGLVLEYNM